MTFNEWFNALPEPRQKILREDKWLLAQSVWDFKEDQVEYSEICLKSWFDTRNLIKDDVDQEILNSVKGYLRVSRSGGMEDDDSDMVLGVIEDMARLSVFANVYVRVAKSKDSH